MMVIEPDIINNKIFNEQIDHPFLHQMKCCDILHQIGQIFPVIFDLDLPHWEPSICWVCNENIYSSLVECVSQPVRFVELRGRIESSKVQLIWWLIQEKPTVYICEHFKIKFWLEKYGYSTYGKSVMFRGMIFGRNVSAAN